MTKKIMATLFFMTLFSNTFAGDSSCPILEKEHSRLREELAPLKEKVEAGKANIKEVNREKIIIEDLEDLTDQMREKNCFRSPSLIGNKA